MDFVVPASSLSAAAWLHRKIHILTMAVSADDGIANLYMQIA